MLLAKLYSFSGNLVDTISPSLVMGDISWSSQINGGQGQATIALNLPISSVISGDIVKIFSVDEYRPSGEVVYSGWVTGVTRRVEKSEYIEISCLGLSSLFSKILASDGLRSGTISSILSGLISEASTLYPIFSSSVETVAQTSYIDTHGLTVQKAIEQFAYTGFSWYLGADGVFDWKSDSSRPVHRLTLGREVEKIDIETDTENIVNRAVIKWSGGTRTVDDSSSIETFGVRAKYEEKTGMDYASAGVYGGSLLSGPKTTMKMTVKNYDTLSILPGHLLSIQNITLDLENLKIHKISYSRDSATVEVGGIDSISHSLTSLLGQ